MTTQQQQYPYPPPPPPVEKPKNWVQKHKVWTAVIAFAALMVVGGIANGGSSDNATPAPTPPSVSQVQPKATPTPEPKATPTPEPTQDAAVKVTAAKPGSALWNYAKAWLISEQPAMGLQPDAVLNENLVKPYVKGVESLGSVESADTLMKAAAQGHFTKAQTHDLMQWLHIVTGQVSVP